MYSSSWTYRVVFCISSRGPLLSGKWGVEVEGVIPALMPGSDGRQESLSRRDFHSFSPLVAATRTNYTASRGIRYINTFFELRSSPDIKNSETQVWNPKNNNCRFHSVKVELWRQNRMANGYYIRLDRWITHRTTSCVFCCRFSADGESGSISLHIGRSYLLLVYVQWSNLGGSFNTIWWISSVNCVGLDSYWDALSVSFVGEFWKLQNFKTPPSVFSSFSFSCSERESVRDDTTTREDSHHITSRECKRTGKDWTEEIVWTIRQEEQSLPHVRII